MDGPAVLQEHKILHFSPRCVTFKNAVCHQVGGDVSDRSSQGEARVHHPTALVRHPQTQLTNTIVGISSCAKSHRHEVKHLVSRSKGGDQVGHCVSDDTCRGGASSVGECVRHVSVHRIHANKLNLRVFQGSIQQLGTLQPILRLVHHKLPTAFRVQLGQRITRSVQDRANEISLKVVLLSGDERLLQDKSVILEPRPRQGDRVTAIDTDPQIRVRGIFARDVGAARNELRDVAVGAPTDVHHRVASGEGACAGGVDDGDPVPAGYGCGGQHCGASVGGILVARPRNTPRTEDHLRPLEQDVRAIHVNCDGLVGAPQLGGVWVVVVAAGRENERALSSLHNF
mmetsp:Transcript_38508/g.86488  ORF Transcript_38508/g.86488 Transcript_38508/m.86488 type:complete len:342 (-) Transcript_38508:2889-3914(-)